MKRIIFFIVLCIGLTINVKAQSSDTCFSKRKIKNIYNNIKVLEHKDSIQIKLIEEYKSQCIDFKKAQELDSITIEGQKIQNANLKANVNDWKRAYETSRPSWYEKPPVMFSTGAILTMILFKLF